MPIPPILGSLTTKYSRIIETRKDTSLAWNTRFGVPV